MRPAPCEEGMRIARPATIVRVAHPFAEVCMALSTILLIVLVVLLIGAIPSWPYSSGWGYGPSGILGVILVVVIVLALMGRL
jgi:hypothetical protein